MASSGALFFLFFVMCIIAVHGKNAFVTVQCASEIVGEYGRHSLLNCTVKNAAWIKNPEIRVVSWRREGAEEPLLSFEFGHMDAEKGYMLAEPSWNKTNMNVSLLITNTVVADAGKYSCMVITSDGDDTANPVLKVSAKYSEPIIRSSPEKINRETGGDLICEAHGGYPEAEIRWFVDKNTDWTKSSRMQANKTQSGLLNLSSKLTLLPSSTFSEYTCVVSSGGKEAKAVFHVDGTSASTGTGKVLASTTQIVAAVVVIGSLIIGLLLLLLLLRRKRRLQEARRQSTTPFISNHQENMYEPDVETCRYLKREDNYHQDSDN